MHTISWIWIYIGRESGWVVNKSSLLADNKDNLTLYVASIYYVMTTFATVGYGDFTGSTNQEYIFTMITQFLGIGFFGYVIGNISTMIGQIDSIQELQALEEEQQSVWQIKLDRSNKGKHFSRHYYDHMNSFFSKYWNRDYYKLKNDEFYSQLKPRLKIEVDDIWFKHINKN